MQPVVSLRQSLDRSLDRQRTVFDLAEKSDFPSPARFGDRHGVLLPPIAAAMFPPNCTAVEESS
jgi:hypothetical protein